MPSSELRSFSSAIIAHARIWHGRDPVPVGRTDFKSGERPLEASGGFDSHSFPPEPLGERPRMSHDPFEEQEGAAVNASTEPTIGELIDLRLSRRAVLKGMAAGSA